MQYTDLNNLLLLLLDSDKMFSLSGQLFIPQTVLLTQPKDLKVALSGSTRSGTGGLG